MPSKTSDGEERGENSMCRGTSRKMPGVRRTPLHLASANGHADVVSLLIERKCELNLLDDENKTPLMKAIECQREACATILLEHGADPNLRDRNSNTILHYIASSETKFMAEKLMKYKIDIEAKNKEGLTPLMLAIKAKNNDMATILLNNGANANAMDGSKRTALMLAVSVEALGLVTLLLQNNADHTLQDTDGWTAEEYAKIHDFPLYVYHKQIEKQMIQIEKPKEQIEEQEPCTSQIRTSAPSLDKKAQENIVEDSISRCSDSSRSVKSRKNTNDELDFDRKERPKLNLMKAKISGETSSSVSTKVATVLKDNQSDNEKDLTDSFAKSSSQAHCSTHAVVHASPANFSQSSLNKSTLLDILKEYPRDSEEAKENDVFVKNDTDNQIFPNIPSQLQAHNTSEKCAERKATKSTSKRSKEEAKSSWDSERSVENLLEGSSRHLASTNQNINKSISLGPEDLSGKNPNVKPSQCGLPMKDPSTSQESEKVVKPKRKLAFMEKVELSAAENTDGHPEKNPNVKPSQCGLPMKDPSTSQESEKVVKPKRKLAFMEKVDLSAAENTDDHPGKNPNVKPSQCGLPMKDPSTSQESEKVVKPKRKLAFMEKVDLSAAEDTDDHPGKNRNVKPNQCGLPMKDFSTRQELEKNVKSKRKLAFMENVDLSAAEDTDGDVLFYSLYLQL
ncbi:POTE ankyrin domain family member E-like [Sarcophilus harrisii]|uniref:POTE ankyrin domain family member E-like n=1 Tax=Sarcophilus harrisii TaxID=9305 RepID=UPI001301B3D7|nr:POTE ankyrin domain family member E-like [Sarcophilus harrisii]